MPRREGVVRHLEELSVEERRTHAEIPYQEHWYRLLVRLGSEGRIGACSTVLDVGAGSGYGLDILRAGGATAIGIDPLPLMEEIATTPIHDFADQAFDLVCAVDVIEHVEDDVAFLAHLVRVARYAVFLSTPNWLASQAQNEFHVREYTPRELHELAMMASQGGYEAWVSDNACTIEPIESLLEPEADVGVNFGVLLRK